jgi:hypothetical protein
MASRRFHRLIQAGLVLGAFSLCFGVVAGAGARKNPAEMNPPESALARGEHTDRRHVFKNAFH